MRQGADTVIDEVGKILVTASFAATRRAIESCSHGSDRSATRPRRGSKGPAPGNAGVEVIEFNSPNRQARRCRGKSDREIVRFVNRHVAREVCRDLVAPEPVPAGAELRARRHGAAVSLQTVAGAIGRWRTRISEFEWGPRFDSELARRCVRWLDVHQGQQHEEVPPASRQHSRGPRKS